MASRRPPDGKDDFAFRRRGAETGKAIARGRGSVRSSDRAMLDRIRRIDPTTRSYVMLMEDNALAEARRADHEAELEALGAAAPGVPIAAARRRRLPPPPRHPRLRRTRRPRT